MHGGGGDGLEWLDHSEGRYGGDGIHREEEDDAQLL
jgi:hypothetical protein